MSGKKGEMQDCHSTTHREHKVGRRIIELIVYRNCPILAVSA